MRELSPAPVAATLENLWAGGTECLKSLGKVVGG